MTHHGEGACVQMPDHAAAMAAKDAKIAELTAGYERHAAERQSWKKDWHEMREKEKVLRKALEEIRELAMTFALVGNDTQRALSESVIGILRRAALASTALVAEAGQKEGE